MRGKILVMKYGKMKKGVKLPEVCSKQYSLIVHYLKTHPEDESVEAEELREYYGLYFSMKKGSFC